MRRQLIVVTVALVTTFGAAVPLYAADDGLQPPGANQGPMTIERVTNGWLVAPDMQFGRVGHSTTTLVGGYGGWMYQNTILIGGAGYFQVDRSEPRTIDYGGGIVEWFTRTDRPIGFGARALLGAGHATIDAGTAIFPGFDRFRGLLDQDAVAHLIPVYLPVPDLRIRHVVFGENFGIFEPQANVLVNLGPRLRVAAAAGYRVMFAARGLEDQLRGVMGSVGFEIGGSSSRRVAP
jgi:hypothetical protein